MNAARKLTLASAAVFCALANAQAAGIEENLRFECRGGSQQFATTIKGRREQHDQSREEDPVIYIAVEALTTSAGVPRMAVAHVTQMGNIIDRSTQYIGKVQRTGSTYSWQATLIRDPSIRMVGVLNTDTRGRRFYTETRYDKGHYAWSVQTKCQLVPDEEE